MEDDFEESKDIRDLTRGKFPWEGKGRGIKDELRSLELDEPLGHWISVWASILTGMLENGCVVLLAC